MAIVFINYRRTDSIGWARSLHDRLAGYFGASAIFYDVDDITSGENFINAVYQNLSDCRVILTVIGPDWLDVKNADGTRRLDAPDDHVRREIEIAIERKVKIIPILVGGAAMPSRNQLPPSIASLYTLNAYPISDLRFSQDIEGLIKLIKSICGFRDEPHRLVSGQNTETVSQTRKSGSLGPKIFIGVSLSVVGLFVLLVIISLVGLSLADQNNLTVVPDSSIPGELAASYCQGFTEGANYQMQSERTEMPACFAPETISSYNQTQARCVGIIDGRFAVARLQGIPVTPAQSDYTYCFP